MAVGDILTTPENGWNRFDDKDTLITYSKPWVNVGYVPGTPWKDDYKYTFTPNETATFSFNGTGIRMIAPRNNDLSSQVKITIDGKEYFYSLYESSLVWNKVCFELIGLPKKTHTVIITSLKSERTIIDAIDIKDGFLVSATIKFLLCTSERIYTIINDEIVDLGDITSPNKLALFDLNGFETLTKENCELIAQELGKAKIMRMLV